MTKSLSVFHETEAVSILRKRLAVLKREREAALYTQGHAGAIIGVSQSAYARIESGETEITLKQWLILRCWFPDIEG